MNNSFVFVTDLIAPNGFKVQSVVMLEEQERAMQADDDDFFEFRRKEERRGWFRRNKKQEYSSKLEKWEVCEVGAFRIYVII